jgi:hypothetical protein
MSRRLGFLVDKDDLINYQLLIIGIYGVLLRIFTYQPTVDKTIRRFRGETVHIDDSLVSSVLMCHINTLELPHCDMTKR